MAETVSKIMAEQSRTLWRTEDLSVGNLGEGDHDRFCRGD
jgi:hypothetical protein